MDVQEFFELCEGQWVSQRTLHHIQTEKTEVNKADLWIEKIDPSAESVLDACEITGSSVDQVICPLEVTIKATVENGRSQINSTLLIPVAKVGSEIEGALISVPKQGKPILGTFNLGTDEIMTLTHPQGEYQVSERIWYASENLRLRSTTLTHVNGPTDANFCSEIRRMGAAQTKPTEADQEPLSPLAAWRARQANSAE
jgi:hypothetical protein